MSDNTRMTTGSRKPGVFIKTAHHENNDKNNDNNDNKNNNSSNDNSNDNYALSFDYGYHWRKGCPELNHGYP